MKKILLVLCLVALTTGNIFAQSFSLTSNGFVDSKDQSKNFIVIDATGSQSELFNKAKTYLTTIYKSPKDVLSESAPDVITINGIETKAVIKKAMGMVAVAYDMNYTIVIRFKDGKIRIDAPAFSLSDYESGSKPIKMILLGSSNGGFGSEIINCIYNKKGDLKAEYAKNQLESYFSSYIEAFKKGLESNKQDW
jgi:hypothetical protein